MTAPQDRTGPGSLATVALPVALLLLAVALRLPGLNGDLWLDEIATLISFVRQPLRDIIAGYESANNHVFYSVLAHLSVGAFGESSWAVRLPAMLFGAATVPALYYLARAYTSRSVATGAALALAVSYHHIYFSQNARGYTGLLFFSVLSTGLLVRALATGARAYWIGFAAAAALNVYVLLSGLFVVIGQLLGVLAVHVLPGRDAAERRHRLAVVVGWAAVAASLTLIVHAPLLGPMFEFFTTANRDVGWSLSGNLFVILLRDAVTVGHPAVVVAGAALLAPVAAVGLLRIVRRAPLLLFALVLPPIIELSVATGMGVGTYPRRFLLVLPFGVLVAVFGASDIATWLARRVGRPAWSSWLFAAAVAAGMVAAGWGLPRLYRLPKQDFRGALEFVAARRAANDVLAGAYMADGPARYYEPTAQSARTAEDLEHVLREGQRVWLIGTFLDDMQQRAPELQRLIERRFVERARFPGLVGDGTVVVWEQER